MGTGEKKGKGERDLLILGNPLVGRPIAPLAINTAPITSKFGCGSLIL